MHNTAIELIKCITETPTKVGESNKQKTISKQTVIFKPEQIHINATVIPERENGIEETNVKKR